MARNPAEPYASGRMVRLSQQAQKRSVHSSDETGMEPSRSGHSAAKAIGPSCADVPTSGTVPSGSTRAAISEAQREEGMTQVRRSLKSFTELPLDTLAADDAAARLGEIRAELRASANPLVARLCEQAAGGGA